MKLSDENFILETYILLWLECVNEFICEIHIMFIHFKMCIFAFVPSMKMSKKENIGTEVFTGRDMIRWVGSFATTNIMKSMGRVVRHDKYTNIRWVGSFAATDTWSRCGPHGSRSAKQRVCITRTDMHHYYLTLHSIIHISRHSFSSQNDLIVMII